MKNAIIPIILLIATSNVIYANIVGSTVYKGKTYYVDVIASSSSATVWLRTNQSMCTNNDIKVLNLSASNPTLKSAGGTICRAKNVFDSGKTIAGCLSSIASGACAAATVPTAGATVAFCAANFAYTVERGLADCIDGVSDKIANYLGITPWAALATKASISLPKWTSVIETAIDNACKDVN